MLSNQADMCLRKSLQGERVLLPLIPIALGQGVGFKLSSGQIKTIKKADLIKSAFFIYGRKLFTAIGQFYK